ncbi:MAG: type II toxin-antitoxin system RelE/ParE family toxin [Chthoniobacterales bacterium]|nr:type II toxin-antitoxin system RelE/ParE family toxin [Chthoniobacterales bacterium]
MSALPKELQLELLAEFEFLPEDIGALAHDRFGVVEREGRRLYRFRAKDYRIYFEVTPDSILVHRVLHKNTLRDFLFRSNLPLDEEDRELSKAGGFWKLIEEGEEKEK